MRILRSICQLALRQQQTFQTLFKVCPVIQPHFVRYKYFQTTGVKGLKGRKFDVNEEPNDPKDTDQIKSTDSDLFDDNDYDCIANTTMSTTKNILNIQNVLVLQPYIKWGPKKATTKPELALQEAEALVRSIPTWTVEHSIKVPLESFDKQYLFGRGKLAELKSLIQDMKRKGQRVRFTTVELSFSVGF